MAASDQIRVVVFKDGDLWVAQCLEYDIGAQASDLDDLRNRLNVVIDAECQESIERHGAPFAGIEPAPRHFFDMWDRCPGRYEPHRPVSMSLENDGQREVHFQLALCA